MILVFGQHQILNSFLKEHFDIVINIHSINLKYLMYNDKTP